VVDSLAVSTSHFRIPILPKLKYDVEVKYMPSIPDNVKYWKVFEDDDKLKRFLEINDEFYALHIDQDGDVNENLQNHEFVNKIANHHIVQLPSNHIPMGVSAFRKVV
jgi:hypothetical protein